MDSEAEKTQGNGRQLDLGSRGGGVGGGGRVGSREAVGGKRQRSLGGSSPWEEDHENRKEGDRRGRTKDRWQS